MLETAPKTIVSFLLDRTGSMEAIKGETIGGFNAYLDTLEREVGEIVEFTLLQFDSVSIDTLYRAARLSDVARLTAETYEPRAYTPLIDACVRTIKETEDVVAQGAIIRKSSSCSRRTARKTPRASTTSRNCAT
jgi:hypothetical protein